MAKEDKFAEEMLTDEELDNVAGGNRLETFADGEELRKRGLLSAEDALHSSPVRDKLHELGYAGYEDKGGLFNANIYKDKAGNTVTREEFWKNFNKENGNEIIR